MAVCAKRLIPRCTGTRILLSRALCVIFCLPVAVYRDQQSNNKSALGYDPLARTNIQGFVEEAKLFVRCRVEGLAIQAGIGESDLRATRKGFE